MKIKNIFSLLFATLLFLSCNDEELPVPKPKGHMRISLPEKKYYPLESECPYAFDYPANYAIIEMKENAQQKCYFNMHFPVFKATIYVSYKEIKKREDLKSNIEGCHQLAYDHSIKASSIEQHAIIIDSHKVYGLLYDIKGNAASPVQFYATDSSMHFIRGALYFNVKPNYDSVKPVLEFIKTDIYRLVNTLKWKN